MRDPSVSDFQTSNPYSCLRILVSTLHCYHSGNMKGILFKGLPEISCAYLAFTMSLDFFVAFLVVLAPWLFGMALRIGMGDFLLAIDIHKLKCLKLKLQKYGGNNKKLNPLLWLFLHLATHSTRLGH